MECTVENKKLVPLSKVVNAALIDTYSDIGKSEQRFTYWSARGLKELYIQALPKIKHKIWLAVNSNTHTATLPLDFENETFLGGIDSNWHKVPMKLNNRLVDSRNVIDTDCEDKCPKCQQDKNICNDLVVTEETNLISINGTNYDQTVVKKLYPNGDYMLETTTPFLDISDDSIDYNTTKEFITNFDLKPCGCLETNDLNTDNLIKFCPDIYCNYYAPCDTRCNIGLGGYRVFEESGLIQFDASFPFDKCYLEYYGFIQKIKGQYYVPYVAFETLVEWTKWRAIKDKANVPLNRIEYQKEDYRTAKANMMKILGRVSLRQIIQSISRLPKFDIDYGNDWYNCFSTVVASNTVASSTPVSESVVSGNTIINNTTVLNRGNYSLALKVDGNPGSPVAGSTSYQNNLLKFAKEITYIFVAKGIETIIDGDFTFTQATGTINRFPNVFQTGDSLIINYNKDSVASSSTAVVNEPVYFYNVPSYDLAWSPELISANGVAGNFYVEILGDDGIYRNTLVEITPNDINNTTNYHFDFNGIATGRITF